MRHNHPTPGALCYLSSFEYPTQHAHAQQARRMAEAFYEVLGDRLTFVVGAVQNGALGDLPTSAPFGRGFPYIKTLGLRMVGYTLWLRRFLRRASRQNVVFTNDPRLAYGATFLKSHRAYTLVVELHGSVSTRIAQRLAERADLLVFTTEGLKERFSVQVAGRLFRSVVLGNAVGDELLSDTTTREQARATLGYTGPQCLLVYVGRFFPMQSDKGVYFMIDALTLLPPEVKVLLVGGTDIEVAAATARAEERGVSARCRIVPYVAQKDVPRYLAAADVLCYVPPKLDEFLETETSPMKLFEYAAARRPMIVSDMSALRAALGDDAAQYIRPGSHEDFEQAVRAVMAGSATAHQVQCAYARVRGNTWNERARKILDCL